MGNYQIKKAKQSKFIKCVTSIGTWVSNFFLIHLSFTFCSLKGGIFLGVFPGFAATHRIFIDYFLNKDKSVSIVKDFNQLWKVYFKKANQIGYTIFIILSFLYIDIRVNTLYIQSPVLGVLLLVLTLFFIFVSIFTFTIMVGFELSYKNIWKQSFFVALSVPVFTIAAIVGLLVAYELIGKILFLAFFFGIPILILPVAWFTFSGLKKVETYSEQKK